MRFRSFYAKIAFVLFVAMLLIFSAHSFLVMFLCAIGCLIWALFNNRRAADDEDEENEAADDEDEENERDSEEACPVRDIPLMTVEDVSFSKRHMTLTGEIKCACIACNETLNINGKYCHVSQIQHSGQSIFAASYGMQVVIDLDRPIEIKPGGDLLGRKYKSFIGKCFSCKQTSSLVYADGRHYCAKCVNKIIVDPSSFPDIIETPTPVYVPTSSKRDNNYTKLLELARIDVAEAEASLALYSHKLFPNNYILVSDGIIYPVHNVITTSYFIPKTRLETFDDVYEIVKIAKDLDLHFTYNLDRWRV